MTLKETKMKGRYFYLKAAIKRGQTRTRSQFAEREQVRRSQSCFHKED